MARTTNKTKTVKKTTRKPRAKAVSSDIVESSVASSRVVSGGGMKRKVWIGLAVLILAVVVFEFRGVFVVAVVNGQPVSRLEVVRRLESQQGRAVLDSLVTEKLIHQEASKAGLEVTDEEIDAEVARFEGEFAAQGQTLEQLLDLQGLAMEDFRQQVMLQKLVEKLAAGDIEISDEEIAEYISANEESLAEDVSGEELHEQVREILRQQKLSSSIQSWLLNLRNGADVKTWAGY